MDNSQVNAELVFNKIENLERSVEQEFRNVSGRLDGLTEQVRRTNGSVIVHDQWIHEYKVVVGNIAMQQKETATLLREHQTHIDQRSYIGAEHDRMKQQLAQMSDYADLRKKVEDHHQFIGEYTGGTKKVSRIMQEWGQVITIIVAIVAIVVGLMKH